MKAEHLELSKLKKAELYNFMKGTRNKEEYRINLVYTRLNFHILPARSSDLNNFITMSHGDIMLISFSSLS